MPKIIKRQLLYCQLDLQSSGVASSADYYVLTEVFREFHTFWHFRKNI